MQTYGSITLELRQDACKVKVFVAEVLQMWLTIVQTPIELNLSHELLPIKISLRIERIAATWNHLLVEKRFLENRLLELLRAESHGLIS